MTLSMFLRAGRDGILSAQYSRAEPRAREIGRVKTRRVWVGSVLMVCLLFSGCMRREPPAVGAAEIGRPAPAFELPDLEGNLVSLEEFRGKIVLVDFWASWCGPCRMTMPMLERLGREYADSMVLLALNLQETPEVVAEYVRSQSIRTRVLLDEEGSAGMAYGTESIPMHFLIDREGILRQVHAGYYSGMEADLRNEIEALRRQ